MAPLIEITDKSLADFIYTPSINLYVAKQRTNLGIDWFNCHNGLQKDNQRMLILPEFIEFLKYLKYSDNEEYQTIYKDITEVRLPWRGEWLDADFKGKYRGFLKKNELYIDYNHICDKNSPQWISSKINLTPKNSELLDKDTLMKDKLISLEDWLENPTRQGLPTKNFEKGNLCYWSPRTNKNSVAWFYASSKEIGLSCDWSPFSFAQNFGIRRVIRKV